MLRVGFSVLSLAICLLVVLGIAVAQAARDEMTLTWDDGSAEAYLQEYISPESWNKVAVEFTAPPAMDWLIGMEVYIYDDGEEHPEDPDLPTTEPFIAWVWAPSQHDTTEPGATLNSGYIPYACCECPEDTLVRFMFPEAIDLSDTGESPSRRFFVGIERAAQDNPRVGLDRSLVGSSHGWWTGGPEMQHVIDGQLVIHAVVSDSATTSAAHRSWTGAKALYR